MKRHLIIEPTEGLSRDQWLMRRKRGIGASDVPTILGYNQYKSAIELWYERLDARPNYSLESISSFMGLYHEDAVADLWSFWDGTEAGMIENYRKGNIVRKCRRIHASVSNPAFPWLYVSLDRIINKTEEKGEGALEIKTIAGYEANKWESGIPLGHVLQLMTQIMVCEFEWGEIATMKDGRNFEILPFDFNPNIGKQIETETGAFWNTVIEGRKITTQKYEAVKSCNMKLADELQAHLEALEPPPDGSEAYEAFLKDKYKKSLQHVGLVKGTAEDFVIAQEHKRLKAKIKELSADILKCENSLKRRIADGTRLDFGNQGIVSWEGNPIRRFANKIKE